MHTTIQALRHGALMAAGLAMIGLPGCGGGGGSNHGNSGRTSISLLIGDAPIDALSSFETVVTGLYLTDDAAVESANLLSSPRHVDLLALGASSELLEVRDATKATYLSARITIDDTAVTARLTDGTPVIVTALGDEAISTFATPLTIGTGDDARVHFELRLDTSVTDDLANPGQLLWTPALVVSDREGGEDGIDELHGRIVAESAENHRLTITLVDRDTDTAHGEFNLHLLSTSLLLDDNGAPFANEAAFFAFATVDDRIEASGVLAADGNFDVDTLQVERDDGGPKVAGLRGLVTAIDLPNDSFVLRIERIDFGHSVVEPILAGLGDPNEVVIDHSGAEFEVRGGNAGVGDETSLVIGQEVKVAFEAFVTEPFAAAEVEIEDEDGKVEGTIVDDAGSPTHLVIHLDADDPAIGAGLVDDANTDVDVVLFGDELITLEVDGHPAIAVSALRTGLRIDVRGTLAGPSSGPSLDANEIEVRPGKLKGVVTAIDTVGRSMTVALDSVDDEFGGPALNDPATIAVDASCSFEGDAADFDALAAEFAALGIGDVLAVEVEGLADGIGGARAYVIDSDVESGG